MSPRVKSADSYLYKWVLRSKSEVFWMVREVVGIINQTLESQCAALSGSIVVPGIKHTDKRVNDLVIKVCIKGGWIAQWHNDSLRLYLADNISKTDPKAIDEQSSYEEVEIDESYKEVTEGPPAPENLPNLSIYSSPVPSGAIHLKKPKRNSSDKCRTWCGRDVISLRIHDKPSFLKQDKNFYEFCKSCDKIQTSRVRSQNKSTQNHPAQEIVHITTPTKSMCGKYKIKIDKDNQTKPDWLKTAISLSRVDFDKTKLGELLKPNQYYCGNCIAGITTYSNSKGDHIIRDSHRTLCGRVRPDLIKKSVKLPKDRNGLDSKDKYCKTCYLIAFGMLRQSAKEPPNEEVSTTSAEPNKEKTSYTLHLTDSIGADVMLCGQDIMSSRSELVTTYNQHQDQLLTENEKWCTDCINIAKPNNNHNNKSSLVHLRLLPTDNFNHCKTLLAHGRSMTSWAFMVSNTITQNICNDCLIKHSELVPNLI